ncbi:MAG: type VI secretion system-associated protein TagF [Acidobacteriota bacterium]
MSHVHERAGWYGKLPALGDFGGRRLPTEFVARCDAWLSQGIQTSQAQLGDRWLHTYLTAPIWRFAWSPGLAGSPWWIGVMMPSVDNVGRYFPLVVAQACGHPPLHEGPHDALDAWLDHISNACMSTLQPGMSVDAFESQLAAAPHWDGAQPEGGPMLRRLIGRDRYEAPHRAGLGPWLKALARQSLLYNLQGQSLWWLAEQPHGGSSISLAPGLPGADQFVELLQGSW